MSKLLTRSRGLILRLFVSATSIGSAYGITFDEAVEQYCRLYSPDSWSSLEDGADLQDIYSYIVVEALKIDNEELQTLLGKVDNRGFSTFYSSLKTSIGKRLIGDWECVDFDNFFYPRQKVIYLSTSDIDSIRIDPESSESVVIMLLASGDVLINNAPLKDPAEENIRKALEISMQQMPISSAKVFVYFDEGADASGLSKLILLLNELGITSFGLIDYSG